jgi:hypothetical protein
MGGAAITRLIKHLKPGWTRHQKDLHLTILLPPDQITPGLTDQVKGTICERSGMERRRTFRTVNSSLAHSNNVDSNQFFNLFFFLIIIPSPFLIRLRGRI